MVVLGDLCQKVVARAIAVARMIWILLDFFSAVQAKLCLYLLLTPYSQCFRCIYSSRKSITHQDPGCFKLVALVLGGDSAVLFSAARRLPT